MLFYPVFCNRRICILKRSVAMDVPHLPLLSISIYKTSWWEVQPLLWEIWNFLYNSFPFNIILVTFALRE